MRRKSRRISELEATNSVLRAELKTARADREGFKVEAERERRRRRWLRDFLYNFLDDPRN